MTHIVLGIGSNINRDANIRHAVNRIRETFGAPELSPVYESEPVGFTGPRFFNCVAGVNSSRPLATVRECLHIFEAEAGRARGRKSFSNRVLDIDILLFGDQVLRPQLNIPRDEIEKYAFVLAPLAELYPTHRHPVLRKSYRQMWQDFDAAHQDMQKVEFDFADSQAGSDGSGVSPVG